MKASIFSICFACVNFCSLSLCGRIVKTFVYVGWSSAGVCEKEKKANIFRLSNSLIELHNFTKISIYKYWSHIWQFPTIRYHHRKREKSNLSKIPWNLQLIDFAFRPMRVWLQPLLEMARFKINDFKFWSNNQKTKINFMKMIVPRFIVVSTIKRTNFKIHNWKRLMANGKKSIWISSWNGRNMKYMTHPIMAVNFFFFFFSFCWEKKKS